MSRFFKFKPQVRLLVAVSLLLPTIALAGGKATMITTEQPMKMEGQADNSGPTTITLTWQDQNTLRMDFGDVGADNLADTYLIMRDGKTYSVSQNDGQPLVMDMSAMSSLMKSMMPKGSNDENPFGNIDSIKATQNSETVAGIKGRVYNMSWTDPDGSKQSDEAVLTDDPLVVEMTQAYLGAMSTMVGDEYTRLYKDALPSADQGLLKVGDQFYVESISPADPPAASFELPAKPMDLQSLMGQMEQMAQ